jgi:hypothetical protein
MNIFEAENNKIIFISHKILLAPGVLLFYIFIYIPPEFSDNSENVTGGLNFFSDMRGQLLGGRFI